jgi:hypothetical protein
MTRLIQIQNDSTRAVALVQEPRLHLGKLTVVSGASDLQQSEANQLLFPLSAGESQGGGERPAIIAQPRYFKV